MPHHLELKALDGTRHAGIRLSARAPDSAHRETVREVMRREVQVANLLGRPLDFVAAEYLVDITIAHIVRYRYTAADASRDLEASAELRRRIRQQNGG